VSYPFRVSKLINVDPLQVRRISDGLVLGPKDVVCASVIYADTQEEEPGSERIPFTQVLVVQSMSILRRSKR
jgi:hypothetical protein